MSLVSNMSVKQKRNKNSKITKNQKESIVIVPWKCGPVADRYRCHLRWYTFQTFNLSVTPYELVRYAPTAAQDINPSSAATKPPGFDILAQLYRSYRVLSSSIKIQATSTSQDDLIQLTCCPINHDPGTSPVAGYYTSIRENPRAVSKALPPRGGPTTVLDNYARTEIVYGNPMTKYDDNFAALVTGTPANNWYWVVVAYCPIVVPEPLLCSVLIEIEIDFYDRAFLERT